MLFGAEMKGPFCIGGLMITEDWNKGLWSASFLCFILPLLLPCDWEPVWSGTDFPHLSSNHPKSSLY
ncbi:polymerase (DNA-directed), epsilon 4 (p12 subunit) (predicted), isoform CRA_b [Rattus norvegicus]|uniref:Polymerase (DNA-directed), epsilon 4 (P12 subunit) (Predicted), isoform CRA_b n=1 Tax=Rattus norvegicus TaxID=10116 RepID=A6IAH8_RAT|nr:polymerase (DNA-directed), epsilon 4 (p12 subunit) (predicted), isoform CRA_b [Rattus norvegicus]